MSILKAPRRDVERWDLVSETPPTSTPRTKTVNVPQSVLDDETFGPAQFLPEMLRQVHGIPKIATVEVESDSGSGGLTITYRWHEVSVVVPWASPKPQTNAVAEDAGGE